MRAGGDPSSSTAAICGEVTPNGDGPGGIEQEGSAAASSATTSTGTICIRCASAPSGSSGEGDKVSRAVDRAAQARVTVQAVQRLPGSGKSSASPATWAAS